MEAASLYNHISSKQEIFQELLLNMARLFTEGMEEIDGSSHKINYQVGKVD